MSMPSISQISPFFQMANQGIGALGQGITDYQQQQNNVQLANALQSGDWPGAMAAAGKSGNIDAVLKLQQMQQQQTLSGQLQNDPALKAIFGGTGGSAVGPATAGPVTDGSKNPPGSTPLPELQDSVNKATSQYKLDPGYVPVTLAMESAGGRNLGSRGNPGQFDQATANRVGIPDAVNNPYSSVLATGALADANAQLLQSKLGRVPTAGEVYLAHQQGPDAAAQMIMNPNARAADIVPQRNIASNLPSGAGDPSSISAGQFANYWTSRYDATAKRMGYTPGVPIYAGGSPSGTALAGAPGSSPFGMGGFNLGQPAQPGAVGGNVAPSMAPRQAPAAATVPTAAAPPVTAPAPAPVKQTLQGPLPTTPPTKSGNPSDQQDITQLVGFNTLRNKSDITGFLSSHGITIDPQNLNWCAAFVDAHLAEKGIQAPTTSTIPGVGGVGTRPAPSTYGGYDLRASAFQNWGQPVAPGQVQPNDVLVNNASRPGIGAADPRGHVGVATGNMRQGANGPELEMISGNVGGGVARQWVPASQYSVRRGQPMQQGQAGQPPVQVAQLGTSDAGPPAPGGPQRTPGTPGAGAQLPPQPGFGGGPPGPGWTPTMIGGAGPMQAPPRPSALSPIAGGPTTAPGGPTAQPTLASTVSPVTPSGLPSGGKSATQIAQEDQVDQVDPVTGKPIAAAGPAAPPPAAGPAAPAAPAAKPAAVAPKLNAEGFLNDNPGTVEEQDNDNDLDLTDADGKTMDWARKNAGKYGYQEDPKTPGHFIPAGAPGGPPAAAPAAATPTPAAAATPAPAQPARPPPLPAGVVGYTPQGSPILAGDPQANLPRGLKGTTLGNMLQGIGLAGPAAAVRGPSGIPSITPQQALAYNQPPVAPGAGAVPAALPPGGGGAAPPPAGAAPPPAAPAAPGAPLPITPGAAPAAPAAAAPAGGDNVANLDKLHTAAAAGPADPSMANPQAAQAGANRVAQSGLSDAQKAAVLTGLALKYSQLPGVGTMFGQMAQHYLQQSDTPQSVKEYLYAKGQGYSGTYEDWQSKEKTPPGQLNIQYAKDNWQKLGLPDPASTDPKDQQIWRDYSAKALGLAQTGQTINVSTKTGEEISTQAAKSIGTNYDNIVSGSGPVAMLQNANRLQARLNDPAGMITGWGSGQEGMTNFANIMANLGFGDPAKVANTQEFTNSAMNDVVTAARTMFPGGRITNADLSMAKISQGLDPAQQKAVLQEAVRIARERAISVISAHNDKVSRFDKKYPDQGVGDLYTVKPEQIPRQMAPAGMGTSRDNAIQVIDENEARAYPKGTWVRSPDGTSVGQVPE
jgi:hypothetical protein